MTNLFTPMDLATGDRLSLHISDADLEAFNSLPKADDQTLDVRDTETGLMWRVNRADCGAACFCDADAERIQ